jgi:ribose transport system substrate-binding protein
MFTSGPTSPRPAFTGFLKTLVHRGYLAQTPSGQYRLVSRPRRLRFGFAVQSAEMPYSEAVAQSVSAAAAASGVELLLLDNRYDPAVAVSNAEEFVAKRVDLVLEFQVEEAAAPRVAHIFKKADIPLVAIDVPHPNSTYFGVDNFEVGYEAASVLAQLCATQVEGQGGPRGGRGLYRGRQLCAEPHHGRLRRNSRTIQGS